MHSPTNRTKLLLPAGILLIVLLLVGLLTDFSRRVSIARDLVRDWRLIEAEEVLRVLASEHPASIEVRRMYADCLLKRGYLSGARAEFAFLVRADSGLRNDHTLSLGFVHYYLGNLDSASMLARVIVREAMARRDSAALARSFNLLGRIAFDQAKYDSATSFQRLSLLCARASDSQQTEADALRQIGVLYWYAGKTDSARARFYEPALCLYRRTNDKIGEATTMNNIGLAGGGVTDLLKAFALRKQVGDQIGLADSYYFISNPVVGGHWNDIAYSLRRKSYQLSLAIGYTWGKEVAARAIDQMIFTAHDSLPMEGAATDSGTISGEGKILRLQLKSSEYMRKQEWHEAARLRARVVTLCDSLHYNQGLGMALASYVDALLELGDYPEAERIARRLQTVWERIPVSAGGVLAKVYLTAGRNTEASALLISIIQQLDAEYREGIYSNDPHYAIDGGRMLHQRYVLFSMLMTSLHRQEDKAGAFEALERFRALPVGFNPQEMKGGLTSGAESIWHHYIRTVEAIEQGADDIEQLVDDFDRAYRNAEERRSVLASSSQNMVQPPIPGITDVQRIMGEDEVLLEYFLGVRDGYVLVLRRDRSALIRLETPVRDIGSAAETFLDLILQRRTSAGQITWKAPAGFLHASLIEPLVRQGIVQDGDHLIISPQGVLHYVPFAALLEGSGRFLVENFTISYVPSAGSILPHNKPHALSSVLAVVPDTKSLRFAEKEIKSIPPELFADKTVLADVRATTDQFLQRASEADLMHLVTHGVADRSHPLFSHLKFSDGPLELHEILNHRFTADLVILTGCETGYGVGIFGDVSYGHSPVGFPQAFLSAGASAVLSPLWVVEDESTSDLIGFFYSHLETLCATDRHVPSGTYARALALAQRQFIGQAGSIDRAHPLFWGGFYLMGNPN